MIIFKWFPIGDHFVQHCKDFKSTIFHTVGHNIKVISVSN